LRDWIYQSTPTVYVVHNLGRYDTLLEISNQPLTFIPSLCTTAFISMWRYSSTLPQDHSCNASPRSAVNSTEPEDHGTQSASCIRPIRHEMGQVEIGSINYGHVIYPISYTFEIDSCLQHRRRVKIPIQMKSHFRCCWILGRV
jgi:hypothetical protein